MNSIPEQGLGKLKLYLYVNLLFWGMLVVVGVAVFVSTGAQWDPVMASVMKFLFLVVGGCFTLVSILDAFYEKIFGEDEASEE